MVRRYCLPEVELLFIFSVLAEKERKVLAFYPGYDTINENENTKGATPICVRSST
jgi:hypothetical protein